MKESSHTLTNVSLRLLRIEAFSFLFIIPFTAYIFISQKNDRKHILELQEAILSIQDAQDTRLNQIETNFISPYKQVIEGEGRVDDLSLQKLSYQTKPTRTESYLSLPSRKVFEKNQKLPLPSRLSGKNKSTILQGSFFLPVEEGLAQLEKDAMTLDIKLEEEKVASTSINYLSKIHKTTHENSAAFSLLKKGESRHLKDSHSATINKNLARNNITPNCMNFTMRIELDDQASETMWTLIDDKEHLVIANYTYSDEKSNSAYTYNLCLVPSQFTLTIFDSDGDGIDCRSKLKGESISCYSYWINGEFKEGINFSSVSKHAIDTNRRCLLGPMVLLKLHFSTDDIHSDFTLLNTETGHTDYEFFQTTDAKLHSNTTETYYICVKPGMYEITLKGTNSTGGSFTCDNSCYDISIEHNPIIAGPSILDESPVSFYVNTEWTARERICHKQPILAAINDVSNFMFDDRAFKILNVLQAISSLENLILPGKDQYKAACFVLYDDANYVRAEDSFLLQRYTLALFLYATNQSAELHLLSNPCLSDKYSCNEMNEITGIDCSRNGLGGVIPREIAHFTKLESLILNDNQLSGTIPREIAKLRNLNVLEASGNKLTGNLPSTIGLMQNLDKILLHDNKISNTIPSEIGNLSNLRYLRLGTNELIGSIPPEIFAHTNLTFFDVSNNKLTGSIPSEIGQCDRLLILYTKMNLLSGSIPSEIGHIASMQYFDSSDNMHSGKIPTEIKNMNWNIKEINLHNNKLTGSLPSLIVQDLLYASKNKLTGEIPEEIWASNVFGLQLEDNELQGTVPDSFCANLSFPDDMEEDGIYDLSVDNSQWFIDQPKVTCPCCSDSVCHLWEYNNVAMVGGTRKPSCSNKNLISVNVFSRYVLKDLIADQYIGRRVTFGISENVNFCLSPTGCFEMQINDDSVYEDDGGIKFNKISRFGYSAAGRGLVEDNSCDAVDICGVSFAVDHPKRKGLNHLTHTVFHDLSYLDDSSLPEYKALCWIMTQDRLFHKFEICDGTLLQRYVMSLFYYSMQESIGFDVLPSTHTCDWLGVTCNPTRLFIEELQLSGLGLAGTIISEIGLLTRLRRLDLSRNDLSGTMDISMFEYLPNLKFFDLSENKLNGKFPGELMMLPSLKEVNVSNNMLAGLLPENVDYTKTLEYFDVEHNLLTGWIPRALMACSDLVSINFSRNFFRGTIPATIGFLKKLKVLKLNQNALSGSLPAFIFNAKNIEYFQVQSNFLTGSIPNTIGNLKGALFMGMNHNFFKASIPETFEKLDQIKYLHLHSNHLTGQAPSFPHLSKLGERERYTSDCGLPSFELAKSITCETCTTCCNSDGMCQANRIWPITVVGATFIILICTPIMLFALMYIFRSYIPDSRNPEDLVDEDSTYCLIFSDSKVAWLLHTLTLCMQGCIYFPFLLASSFSHKSSDWQFTIRCPSSNVNCNDESTVSALGWVVFYLISIPTLGVDFVRSILQIQKAASLPDLWLFCSGSLHLGITILALIASIYYNLALATTNTVLILNAVMLLFINDLDEQIMNCLGALVPKWTMKRIEEARKNLSTRKKENSDKKEVRRKKGDHEEKVQQIPFSFSA